MHRITDIFIRVLASRAFFIFVVILLTIQSLWIALSFKYPMLWDEYYHFGLIQFYGHHINPFIAHQPHSLDLYGNVERSPKYLYHYLLSYPYRLISIFTTDQTIQVIWLRLLNIGLFAGGIVAFRQTMIRLSNSKALVHFVLLILVLLPFTPLLAAQVNYDNLEFLLTGLVFYWTLRFVQAKEFEIKWLFLIVGGGLLASVANYSFLPILLAIILFLSYHLWERYGKSVFKTSIRSFVALGTWSKVGLVLLVLLGTGLSMERFATNEIKYHSIDPECSKVINVQRCMSFSPFKQEYSLSQETRNGQIHPLKGAAGYTLTEWFPQLYEQYFTTGTQLSYGKFVVEDPFKIPFITVLIAGAIGLICFFIYIPKALRRPEIWLILLVAGMLTAVVWLIDHGKYVRTSYPLAIQGRYMLPVVPFGLLLGGIAANRVLRWRKVKVVLAALTLTGLVWGGGALTSITLSQPTWYWQNRSVIDINQSISHALLPVLE